MDEERNRVARRQNVARNPGANHAVDRATTAIIRQPLQEIRDVDEDGSSLGHGRFEVTGVEGIDLETAHVVLEQERAETEVCVGDDPRVALLLHDLTLDGRVVDKAQLRVCFPGDVVEEVVAQVHGHGETLQHVERKREALAVEIIQRLLEARELGRRGTLRVRKAPVLVALFVVYTTVRFIPVSGVALVYFCVFETPCKLLLDRKVKEGLGLCRVSTFTSSVNW
jgi:hypothetical protein